MIDPKTGLPLTPEELREREIDKFDPMKRNVDPAAQPTTDPLTDRQQPTAGNTDTNTKALPGSSANSDADSPTGAKPGAKSASAGDSTADSATDSGDTNGAEYSGPSVLSRSYTLARPMVPNQVKWTASVGFNYSFDDGQTPTLVNDETVFTPTTTSGRSVTWSFSGRHLWKRDQLGISYNGSDSTFGVTALSGVNNSLNLDYSHVVSSRISVHFVQSLQDLSQNYSLQNPNPTPGTTVANLNLAASPNVQLLNSTTRQSSSSISMTFRQTGRLSYNISSSYFLTGRTQGVGMTGTQFGGDMNYRWTRKATVGAYYSYTSYLYSHNISSSDSNGVGMIFSYALDRYTQLRTRFGATRIESLGYETVALDPGLAALLGQSSTIINAYSLRWTSDISVELVRDFRRTRTLTLAYAHGQSPGNGVLLTSVQQTMSAGYAMSFFRRRLPLNVNANYSTLSSLAQGAAGYYKSETASVTTSRHLWTGINSTLTLAYRRYDVSGSPGEARDITVSLGFAWGVPGRWLRF